MKSPIHILHLEDEPNDAALVHSALETEGIKHTITLVATQAEFLTALEKGGIDLVLADYLLPGFDGLSAIALVHVGWPDLPVILVSGTLGEEVAIDSLKSGATDYVLKERLARLAPAVYRAMREVEERTERRRLEAQFIEAQKMEVIGHLASGIAHDFNNILAVIMGYSDMIAAKLVQDSVVQTYTEEIRHASERAVGLTRQLLIFSRNEKVQPIVLDLNESIVEMDRMLRRLIDEDIELIIATGKDTGRISADPGYIGQVLMNLVVNARDAMPRGGKLTIATSNVSLNLDEALDAGTEPGNYVLMSVRDNGCGMTEDVKARLFEAFFTTKPLGKGTGLGLATCQTIVKQCGGHISVMSSPEWGTTFQIYFPRVDAPAEVVFKSTRNGALAGGTEALLLVEDEPAVRHLAKGVLEAQGYEVLSASNGQEGLHVAQEHRSSTIRLVVTDVIMPLMGGKVMAEWLKATYPDLKVLFTSGYTDESVTQHGVLETDMEFLPKPYTPATLTRKVREMLDASIST